MNKLLLSIYATLLLLTSLVVFSTPAAPTGGTRNIPSETGWRLVYGREEARPPIPPLPQVRCGQTVTVAVVDTGIDYTHQDLREYFWLNQGETGQWAPPLAVPSRAITCRDKSCNGIDDDGNGYVDDVHGWDFVRNYPTPYDHHGHGTHISGIIANVFKADGVGCLRIMSLRYYDNSGAGGYNNLTNTVRALQYAISNGAQVINYSGGGGDPAATERAAVEEAQKKGILLVAAAGNDGHNNAIAPYYPSSYPLDNIIAVASVNKQNQLLPSSNFGGNVSVAAPGLMILSTLPEGKYGTMSGTSQATAFVTGAAAVLASRYVGDSKDMMRSVRSWIHRGATPLAPKENRYVINGALNLKKSLELQAKDRSVRGKR